MMPLQILIQNLLYDFSQGSIPFDNVDEDYLARPVRWSLASVARFMIIFGPVSSIFDITTYSINWWYFGIKSNADSAQISLAQYVLHPFFQRWNAALTSRESPERIGSCSDRALR